MKKLIVILYLLLPIMVMAAGTEVLDPDVTLYVGSGWDSTGCTSGIAACLGDDSDPTQIWMSDNDDPGSDVIVSLGNPSMADSTIDSVVIVARWKTDNTSCKIAIIDSVVGQSSAMRQNTEFTIAVINTWENHSLKLTGPPDGGSFSWADLANYIVGIDDYAHINNKWIYCTKLEVTIHYHDAGGAADAYEGQAIIIGGQ